MPVTSQNPAIAQHGAEYNTWNTLAGSALVIAIGCATSIACADEDSDSTDPMGRAMFDSRHVISGGVAIQSTQATISATSELFDPVSLSLDDLGVEERDESYYLEYRYRFKPKWSVLAGAYSFSGSGGQTAERDFNYDGVEFTAGTEVQANLDVDAYILDVLYRVYANDDMEIHLGGGIHSLDLGVEIGGQVRINETTGEFRQSGTTLLAPVPNLRGAVSWALTDRFGLNFVGGWLSAKVDDYDGRFLYGHVRGIYRMTDSLGVSLGYQFTDIDITQTRAQSEVSFDVTLDGPTLTLQYSF